MGDAPKTVLVTGATGFAGAHTLRALNANEGITPVAACRNPATLDPAFTGEVRVGDLTDPAYRQRVLKGVDAVAHCAAWTAAWGHAGQSLEHHLKPALAFIDDVVAAGVRRFVHISSTAVAAPGGAADAMSRADPLPHFPHMDNVRKIEEYMRSAVQRTAPVDTAFINLRLGFFAGAGYGLGILPLLLPRLKTHLVPWVAGGRTHLPLIDGRDVGQALARAATRPGLDAPYMSFNVIGPENPTVRQVIDHLHSAHGYPRPHFGVSFPLAYAFAWAMEKLDPVVPWEPLVTRSIIHFLEDQDVDNRAFAMATGYHPRHSWQTAIRVQLEEMAARQTTPMSMVKPLPQSGNA